jgi:hypothetical protein
MSEQTIQSRDVKVADVFQSFYVVPDYQREYVWGTDEVEQLLADISAELADAGPEDAPEYFIGSIVVCPGRAGVLDLIDGQQRMTTLFLALCAIRDRFEEMGKQPPGALGPQIAATSTDAAGVDQFRYRLDLQYEDSGDVLVRIASRTSTASNGSTRSIANILNAYEVILAFLRREYGDDEGRLRAFYGYVTNKVKLIRIHTEDVAKALKIFETINDRGVGLDAMDLLKNLLFMKAGRAEFEKLKTIWKQMQDTIYGMGEKPLRFLRYFILSRYDVELLREDQIYGWFARNESTCGYGTAPVAFANELLEAAKAYSQFLKGYDQRGTKNQYLENLRLLGGKAARQHLILLLAGRHLSTELFDRLARQVENLFFIYVITREATRTFERNFARWASELRRVKNEEDFEVFSAKTFRPARAGLSERFDDAFRRLELGSVQQYRLRYILAKITQYVDIAAYGETECTRWLDKYMSNGFEIEHIYPQTPDAKATEEFGPTSSPAIVERLGNLLLVEKSINASLGNRPYSEKRSVYPKSQLLLTRSIAERPQIGARTRIDLAVAGFEPFDEWNELAVLRRQETLSALARIVWEVPSKGQ